MAGEVLVGGLALHDASRAREEAQVVDHGADLVDGGADGLAPVAALEAPELVGARLHGVGEAEQQEAAVLGRALLPALEGRCGCAGGAIDVLGGRCGHRGDDLAVGGIAHARRSHRWRWGPSRRRSIARMSAASPSSRSPHRPPRPPPGREPYPSAAHDCGGRLAVRSVIVRPTGSRVSPDPGGILERAEAGYAAGPACRADLPLERSAVREACKEFVECCCDPSRQPILIDIDDRRLRVHRVVEHDRVVSSRGRLADHDADLGIVPLLDQRRRRQGAGRVDPQVPPRPRIAPMSMWSSAQDVGNESDSSAGRARRRCALAAGRYTTLEARRRGEPQPSRSSRR